MSTTKTYKEKLQLVLNTKTQFKNDIINAGGTIDNSTPFSSYPAIYKTLKGGAPDGTAIEINTPEGMAAAITESNIGKFYKYTGPSTAEYNTGDLYIVQDLDNPLVDECSGGSAAIQGYMPTPVPNSGLVEKLVFNIDLTPTEVDNIIANANLDWIHSSSTEPPLYFVFFNMEVEAALMIMNYGILIGEGVIAYMIMAVIPGGESDPIPIYSSSIIKELLGGIEGWNTALFEELGSNVFPLNAMAESNREGMPIGAQNESIKELINIGGVEPYYKELSGTYKPIDLNITENTTIDLVTQYMDNKQMPINLNVQTTSGTLDITTNGEHDVSKYEKANVNVQPNLQSKSVSPTTTSMTIKPDSGYDGLSQVSISINAQNIDSDFKAENIKKGVNILGINGKYTGAVDYSNDYITEIAKEQYKDFDKFLSFNAPNVTIIGEYAFMYCSNLKSFSCSPNVTEIPNGAFRSCSSLENFDTSNIKKLGNETFYMCGNMEFDMPNLEEIGDYAFGGCFDNQKEIVLPKLKKIPYGAFSASVNLEKADFTQITSISSFAFGDCFELKTLIIRNTTQVCTLENVDAFNSGTPIASGTGYIYVPDTLVDQYKVATNWSTYANQIKPLSEYVE